MSARHLYSLEAEELNYGFLAVKAKAVLSKSLNDEALTDSDHEVLQNAAKFLSNISEGARLVETKELHGHKSDDRLAALSVALDPLSGLQSISEDEDIADFIGQLSAELGTVSTRQASHSPESKDKLKLAADIFGGIYNYLNSSLSEKHRVLTNSFDG